MGEEQCKEISVEVVAPPYVALEPMSLTVNKVRLKKIQHFWNLSKMAT